MGNEIIRISKNDMLAMQDRSDTIDRLNQKIQIIRKKQLLTTLKVSTDARLKLLGKLDEWIDKIDRKLMSDESINNMSIGQLMSIFKFIGTFSLKMLGQTNDLEGLMKEYIETINISERLPKANPLNNDEERNKMKADMVKSFMDSLKASASKAIVSQQQIEAEHRNELNQINTEQEIQNADIIPSVEVKVPDIIADIDLPGLPEELTDEKLMSGK